VAPALHDRPVKCARPGCGHDYLAHNPGGCQVITWRNLNQPERYDDCPGFLWVAP